MATESESKVKGFKRINFFKGFLTTEHDWNDAERYHIEKRRLHNKMMHAPGVVFGFSGDLKVTARPRGDLSVEIQPGYAVDGQGRDLMLWDAEIKTLVLEEYKLPQTIYIVLRYYEQETDFIAYKENAAYKGHRRILEGCKVEISQTAPDIREEVELARILLDKTQLVFVTRAIRMSRRPTRSICALCLARVWRDRRSIRCCGFAWRCCSIGCVGCCWRWRATTRWKRRTTRWRA